MNFHKKKSFILISMLLISLVILSGCGGGSSSTETENATLKAMSTVNSALKEFEQENTDGVKEYAHNDTFRHVSASTGDELTLNTYLSIYDQIFAAGAEYDRMDLEDTTTELVASDEVKITGVAKLTGTDVNGDPFDESFSVEFRVKNFGGTWLITKMVD